MFIVRVYFRLPGYIFFALPCLLVIWLVGWLFYCSSVLVRFVKQYKTLLSVGCGMVSRGEPDYRHLNLVFILDSLLLKVAFRMCFLTENLTSLFMIWCVQLMILWDSFVHVRCLLFVIFLVQLSPCFVPSHI